MVRPAGRAIWSNVPMAAKGGGRDRHRTPHRAATRQHPPRRAPGGPSTPGDFDPDSQPLIQGLRAALRHPDPTSILVAGCAVAHQLLVTARDRIPGEATLLESFLEVPLAETTAVLHLAAALTHDDLIRAEITRTLAERRHPVPSHVRELGAARAHAAYAMADELGDGDNHLIGVRIPGGTELTLVVYVDHTMGTIVKDAFLIPRPLEEVRAQFDELVERDGLDDNHPTPVDLAEVRARIEQALVRHDAITPDWEQDDWPMIRPLVEHVVATLPTGGAGYAERAAYSSGDLDRDVRELLASPEAAGLEQTPQVEMAVAALLAYAAARQGDPHRWSAPVVENALVEEIAWDPLVPEIALDEVCRVLPAVVRFSHRVAGKSRAATLDTLAAIDRWAPVFTEIRQLGVTRDLRESQAALDALIAGDPRPYRRRQLLAVLGSPEAVDALDDTPLPDEPLDLTDVPADLHVVLTDISRIIDLALTSGELPGLDVELRTACRRFLTRCAIGDPAVLRRRASTKRTAAAVVWLLGSANDLSGRGLSGTAIEQCFGVGGNLRSRAEALAAAVGGSVSSHGPARLDDVGLLTSTYRRELIDLREGLVDALADAYAPHAPDAPDADTP